MIRTTKNDILEFLERVKASKPELVCRKKNLAALAKAGMTVQDVHGIVERLEVRNFFNRSLDRDRQGNVAWEFGIKISWRYWYIKIVETPSFEHRIVSCHPAEKTIRWPRL